jgi:hypothetical protein
MDSKTHFVGVVQNLAHQKTTIVLGANRENQLLVGQLVRQELLMDTHITKYILVLIL